MDKLLNIDSDSKGESPIEKVKKYNMFVLNHVEKLVNVPFSPLNCRIPGSVQSKFSGAGLLVACQRPIQSFKLSYPRKCAV